MKRLRVLQVLEATGGGTRRHLREIFTQLSEDEFEFSLVCATRREPTMLDDCRLFRELGVGVEIVDMVRRPAPLLDIRAALALRARIRRNPVDLVHLHSSKAGFVGRLATLNLDVPVIYSPHGFPFLQPGWIGRASLMAEKALAFRADRLVAVSRAEGRLAVTSGLFQPESVTVVENAVERRIPTSDAPNRGRGLSFGFLGELREQKDPLTFVRAARAALTRGLRARFVMPRRGGQLGAIEREIARLDLGGFFDLVPADDSLDNVHQRCDLGVLPSRWEGLPYALLDSMAMGKPVITSSLDVFRDVVEPIEPALVFDTGNVDSLASCLLHWQAARPQLRASVARAVTRFVARAHTMSNWSRRLRDVYYDVAGATARPSRAERSAPLAITG